MYGIPYVQYKFFVDGEWRHDEHQPYVSGEYGIVNTILLATDPNILPNPGISSGPSMDVDEAFQNLVRIGRSFFISCWLTHFFSGWLVICSSLKI